MEMVVRVARAILTRVSQESDPLRAAGIEAGYRVLAASGYLGAEPESPAPPERQVLAMVYDSESRGGLGWNLHQVRPRRLAAARFGISADRVADSPPLRAGVSDARSA